MPLNESQKSPTIMTAIVNGIDGQRIFTTCGEENLTTRRELLAAGVGGILIEQIKDECPCGDIRDESPRLFRYFDVTDLLVVGVVTHSDELVVRTNEQHPFRKRVYSLMKNQAHVLMEEDMSSEIETGNLTYSDV